MWTLTHFKAQQKVLINGCDTCFDDILDKMNELQEHQKIMICKLLMAKVRRLNRVLVDFTVAWLMA